MYGGSLLVARISMADVSQCASEQVWSWFLNPPQDLCCTLTSDLMVQCRYGFGEPERLVCVSSQNCQFTWISLIRVSISFGSESSLALPIALLFCFH